MGICCFVQFPDTHFSRLWFNEGRAKWNENGPNVFTNGSKCRYILRKSIKLLKRDFFFFFFFQTAAEIKKKKKLAYRPMNMPPFKDFIFNNETAHERGVKAQIVWSFLTQLKSVTIICAAGPAATVRCHGSLRQVRNPLT